MRPLRWAPRGDEGMSSILGFIVGLALLAGSMATAAYFMTSTPKAGAPEESKELSSTTIRTVEALTTSPGEPKDWHTITNYSNDDLKQVGLLREGTKMAQLEKIQELQEGNLTATRILESFNLKTQGFSMDVTGQVVPVPVLRPPHSTTYAVANGTGTSSTDIDASITADTRTGIDLFAEVNHGFEPELQEWIWRQDKHPDNGLGNTFADTAWFMDTQLLPKTAGLEATYTITDHAPDGSIGEAAVNASDSYNDGERRLSRWHVAKDDDPFCIPGGGDAKSENGSQVLALAYRKNAGGGNQDKDCNGEGIGLWRSRDGMKSYALLGGFDLANVEGATMSFDHLLWVNGTNEEEDAARPLCKYKNWTVDTSLTLDDLDDGEANECVRVRPSIYFWNATTDGDGNPTGWTNLSVSGGPACPASNWDDTGDNESTGGNWKHVTVDLCEAVSHASGKLWLAFGWTTGCINQIEDEVHCGHNGADEAVDAGRAWFVDNVDVDTDAGGDLYKTTVEPMQKDRRESLFVSHGVTMDAYKDADAGLQESLVVPLRHFVQAGGNAIALAPGSTGDWLVQIGLEAVHRNGTQHVTTPDPNQLVMRLPYELPAEHRSYNATNVIWSAENVSSSNPFSDGMEKFRRLKVVQNTTQEHTFATLLTGDPYPGSGTVSAISYDVSDFNDTKLRDRLVTNLYTAALFIDPTFDAAGSSVPDAGSHPVHATKRVVLAEVTEDQEYQIPLEVTLYMWPVGHG